MSQFIIEQIRYIHEEIELIEKAIANLIEEKTNSRKRKIGFDYAIDYLLDKIENKSKILLKLYEDKDHLKKEEEQFIAGCTQEKTSDLWKNYYEKIKYIRDYHKKNNIKDVEVKNAKSYQVEALKYNKLKESFSPLEKYGRYVDMSACYNEFINIKKIKEFRINTARKMEMARMAKKVEKGNGIIKKKSNKEHEFKEIDMVTYLQSFNTVSSTIPRYCKYKNEEYKTYLSNLLSYLISFFKRINILIDCDKTYEQYEKAFNEGFEKKQIKGWEQYTHEMEYFCNINDKLFASEGTFNSYLKSKKYKEEYDKYTSKNTEEKEKEKKRQIEKEDREMAKLEFLIDLYSNLLNRIIQKTIQKIQRTQSCTIEEIQRKQKSNKKNNHLSYIYNEDTNNGLNIYGIEDGENRMNNQLAIENNDLDTLRLSSSENSDYDSSDLSEEQSEEEEQDDDDEENKPIYNPLNLPLGYDNKPIPYWLYKLHGLSKEYRCEICGNYSYFGRTAFEKHFYEWRHSFGMKCLKIPNTMHFKEITKIEDALNLYKKLKKKSQDTMFMQEKEIECEDSKGNVMDIKSYQELLRQGLV